MIFYISAFIFITTLFISALINGMEIKMDRKLIEELKEKEMVSGHPPDAS
jgi:hypothetical protein